MRTKGILFSLLLLAFFSCEKEEKDDKESDKTTIAGEEFTPTESSVVNTGESLTLTFTEGTKKVEIITNDTIEGTYEITSSELKSTTLQANLTFTDGTTSYIGTIGSVVITDEGENVISGSYEATVVSDTKVEVEISSGAFSELEVEIDEPEEEEPSIVITEESINDTLALCYSNLESFIELSYLFDAVYSNSITSPNTSWDAIYGHTLASSNEKINQLWDDGYDIILLTNFVLEQADEIITDEETKNLVIAQAKAIRAYVYYTLYIWYGDLPLIQVYQPDTWSRSSKEDIFELIQADAESANEILPSSWEGSENKVVKSFVQGLICRNYLETGSYSDAQTLALQIINSGEYALDATVDNITSSSTEVYWGFDKGDNEEFNTFFTKGSFVPVIRYTETILIAAEALYNLGQQMEAISYINMLKNRRSEAEIMSIDNDVISNQWEVELTQEGCIFNTLKRYSKATSELSIEDYRLILPIPQLVLETYPSMTQNPGY